jgi:hypothetical protein
LSESEDQVDLAATLVPTTADPAELDEVATEPRGFILGALGYMDCRHHGLTPRLDDLTCPAHAPLRQIAPSGGHFPANWHFY